MQEVKASLTEDQIRSLLEIAGRRGVDANTVLQQAITTEKLISDNVKQGDELLIRRPDNTVSKVIFE